MTDRIQTAGIRWRDDGVPVSVAFDDPYFSLAGGLAETRHVFLAGNDLPARFVPGFVIGELGFGTGLNLLAAVAAHRASGARGRFGFATFEAFPMAAADMARAHAAFGELAEDAAALRQAVATSPPTDGTLRFALGPADVALVLGPAESRLAAWPGRADAWFLDGFAPARNPAMWAPALLSQVAAHTCPGGTFATYTAAGDVRRALADAGFAVTRLPGFGTKRHMTTGRLEAAR